MPQSSPLTWIFLSTVMMSMFLMNFILNTFSSQVKMSKKILLNNFSLNWKW